MKLRKLNNSGLAKFDNYLDSLENDGTLPPPIFLLSDPTYSTDIRASVELETRNFSSRFDVASYLHPLFASAGIPNLEKDTHLWAWCTLYFFDTLCPLTDRSHRKPRERAAYIPEPENFQRYYRHLLLGPYLIYRAHNDNPSRAMALLCKPPHIISDIEAQIAAYQELVTNRSIVELTTKLYYDPKSKATKRGAGSKGAGSPRRLVAVLNQFDLTWDLYATATPTLMKMLPKEFEKFAKNIG
jgi:hypothetical protein